MNLLDLFKKKITVVTHNGSFHADDVFACATLSIWAEKEGRRIKVIRTRDPNIISKADMVVDVGMEYDPTRNRFDHHQKGGAGKHDNSIPYASFGLIWKHFGEKICEKEIAETIRHKLVTPIDAADNGINLYIPSEYNTYEYSIGDFIAAINNSDKNKDVDILFNETVEIAKQVIWGEINKTKFKAEGERTTIQEIEKQHNPEILILDKFVSWSKAVSENKAVKLVIYPERGETNYCIEVARDDIQNYNSNRVNLPLEWAGLRGEELENVSGIKGSVFCHLGRFFAVADSKQGAIEMAQKALELGK